MLLHVRNNCLGFFPCFTLQAEISLLQSIIFFVYLLKCMAWAFILKLSITDEEVKILDIL